jgi:hypothetical protein
MEGALRMVGHNWQGRRRKTEQFRIELEEDKYISFGGYDHLQGLLCGLCIENIIKVYKRCGKYFKTFCIFLKSYLNLTKYLGSLNASLISICE